MNNLSYMGDSIGNIMRDYDGTADIVKSHNKLSFDSFISFLTSDYAIFRTSGDLDLEILAKHLSKIATALPSIIRIFQKPVIQLDELDDVLPIEAVDKINNRSLLHLSLHSELWKNIENSTVVPQKLLTTKYLDNYSIYENIVFAYTVDLILAYLSSNMRSLKYSMYTGETVKYNMLDKVNHRNYLFALGILRIEYMRDFSVYYKEARNIYGKMNRLYHVLQAYLNYRVYAANKRKYKNLRFHTTNILSMHKDYRTMFELLRFMRRIEPKQSDVSEDAIRGIFEEYYNYCKIILLFSAQNFGFSASKDSFINFSDLDIELEQNGWKLHLLDMKDGFLLTLNKSKEYRIMIIPSVTMSTDENDIQRDYDEILYFSPLISNKHTIFVSRTELDSFRRIQQILLRSMIYSDDSHDICPFCGGKMERERREETEIYVCYECNTLIEKKQCPTNGRIYYATKIKDYSPSQKDDLQKMHLNITPDFYSELFCYRNITNMTSEGECICPYCDQEHAS